MLRMPLSVAAAALMLSACGQLGATADDSEAPASIPKTLEEADPEAYNNSIQAALSEIPEELKAPFQRLFICEVRRNNASAKPRTVDATYIRALVEYLKQNPTAPDHCSS